LIILLIYFESSCCSIFLLTIWGRYHVNVKKWRIMCISVKRNANSCIEIYYEQTNLIYFFDICSKILGLYIQFFFINLFWLLKVVLLYLEVKILYWTWLLICHIWLVVCNVIRQALGSWISNINIQCIILVKIGNCW